MATWLGIDIGGTKVALRAEGDVVADNTFRWRPDASPADDLGALASAVRDLGGAYDRVGVAMPATVDPEGRVTTWPGRPSWDGFAFGAELRDLFDGTEVRYADDGDLAALAEAAHAGHDDIVYVGVGTGIGGGVVLDGRLIPGLGKGSCEVGHMVIDRHGPICDCGRRGCLQAVASGPATLRRAGVDFADLRAGWLAGDEHVLAAVVESCEAVATAVVTLSEVVRPGVAVVGGGFADGLPGFVDVVAEHVHTLGRAGHPTPPVQAAALGGLSSLRGALLLARNPA
ncbi:ROK family protein [Kutzneria sp. 744]|uniref:ROK family protein n=1 Tax=Kutzneria sp. (strain 744) TaxID=345341 RepID=UPI0003EED975|nr:ROK family protein [Kutzneria sp. 744]EWM18650.1 ROK family protein [Kutzneria sp. 744]